eukprot:scaffold114783_cov69-Phaeocystis_antarctica.AAC.8
MGTTSASSFAQRDFNSDSSHHICSVTSVQKVPATWSMLLMPWTVSLMPTALWSSFSAMALIVAVLPRISPRHNGALMRRERTRSVGNSRQVTGRGTDTGFLAGCFFGSIDRLAMKRGHVPVYLPRFR